MPLRTITLLIALSFIGPALAQSRQSTAALSCAAATALVDRSAGIVLDTGAGTYERFVRDRSFCANFEGVGQAYAPTRDKPQCDLGYVCGSREGRATR
jgi:hypothetical protein